MPKLLIDLYRKQDEEEVLPWIDNDTHRFNGFSIIRDYPKNCGFIPAVNKTNKADTKVLIKIGYSEKDIKDNKVYLYPTVSKFSVYLEKHHLFDFNDQTGPTKESIDESKKSYQPVDLEEPQRYIFNIETEIITDLKKKVEVTLNNIADHLYEQHIGTIKGIRASSFKIRAKFKTQIWEALFNGTDTTEKALISINKLLFGKSLIKEGDSFEGLFKTYNYKNLVTIYPQAVPFFSSAFQISKACIFWIALTLLGIWKFTGSYLKSVRQMNDTYSVAIVILLVSVFDTVLPYFILFLTNQTVKLKIFLLSSNWLTKTKY